jgi:hypothetical protein
VAAAAPAGCMSRSGRGSVPRLGPSPRFRETRHSLSPRTGPLTTPQASRHATNRIIAPPCRPSTLGFGSARFRAEPPACYPASWQLPGPDFRRQATTSLRTQRSTMALRHGVTSALLGARTIRANPDHSR